MFHPKTLSTRKSKITITTASDVARVYLAKKGAKASVLKRLREGTMREWALMCVAARKRKREERLREQARDRKSVQTL